jgi:hypothetical protein
MFHHIEITTTLATTRCVTDLTNHRAPSSAHGIDLNEQTKSTQVRSVMCTGGCLAQGATADRRLR